MSEEKNDFFNQIMKGNTAEYKVADEPMLFEEEQEGEQVQEEGQVEEVEGAIEGATEGVVEEKAPEIDIEALLLQRLEEKSGGKFKSFEDLTKEEKRELEFKDEISAKLFKSIKDGEYETVKDLLDKKLFDANKLKPIDAVTMYYKDKYPDLTDEDIQEELYDKYGVGKLKLTEEDKSLMSEEEIKAYEKELRNGARELKKVETEAKKYLNDNRSVDFDLPDVELGTKIPEDYMKYDDAVQKIVAESQAQQKETLDQWNNIVNSELPKVGKSLKYKVNLGDKEGDFEFDYELSSNQEKQLKDYLSDYGNTTNYDQKFVSGDGKDIRVDVKSLAQEKARTLFFDEILKSAIKEARNTGKEEVLSKTIKNSNWSKEKPVNDSSPKLNFWQQQIANK